MTSARVCAMGQEARVWYTDSGESMPRVRAPPKVHLETGWTNHDSAMPPEATFMFLTESKITYTVSIRDGRERFAERRRGEAKNTG